MFFPDDREELGAAWLLTIGAVREGSAFRIGHVWWSWDTEHKTENPWIRGGWRCYYTTEQADVGESKRAYDRPRDAIHDLYRDIEKRLAAAPAALMEIIALGIKSDMGASSQS